MTGTDSSVKSYVSVGADVYVEADDPVLATDDSVADADGSAKTEDTVMADDTVTDVEGSVKRADDSLKSGGDSAMATAAGPCSATGATGGCSVMEVDGCSAMTGGCGSMTRGSCSVTGADGSSSVMTDLADAGVQISWRVRIGMAGLITCVVWAD